MVRFRHKARLEWLEARLPLAAAHPAALSAVAALVAPPASGQPPGLSGTTHGTYSIAGASPGAIRSVKLNGSGTVRTLGRVRITGLVQQTGLAGPGQQVGLLTLANARGRVTLRLNAQD